MVCENKLCVFVHVRGCVCACAYVCVGVCNTVLCVPAV